MPALTSSLFAPRLAFVIAGCSAMLLASGCQSLQSSDNFLGVITPYRVEVVQGNVITSEQAALAKPGLTRAQVRDVVVQFKSDVLASIDAGGELPSERAFVAAIDTFKTSRNAPPLALTDEELKALPPPVRPPAEDLPLPPPARTYPPLEPGA